jgi:hypothetical protein
MKTVAVFALSIFSVAAIAMPKVGDMAVFKGTFEGSGGGSIPFEQALTIKELTEKGALVESTLLFDGQQRKEDLNLAPEDLFSTEAIELILAECEKMGGELETLKVDAGEFQTCAVSQGAKLKFWLSHVPFGIVKQIQLDDNDNIITIELKDYRFGK